MRSVRYFILFSLTVTLAVVSTFAQIAEKPKNAKFDAGLAKKLGADKYGMKSYILAILKTGPKDADIKGIERDQMFKGHMANINWLAAEGKLAVAGPFGKNDIQFRGLFILNVTSVEDAKKLTDADPAVKAGVMIVEFIPWYGTAALMQTNEIHERIAEQEY